MFQLWYFWSGCTLFLNKYVVFYMKGDATFLACSQMWITAVAGLVQMRFPLGHTAKTKPNPNAKKPKNHTQNMVIVGGLRYATVLLGLVALNYVEVSFTETVKSSAPAFTVLIAWLLLHEKTGLYVNLSLIPVMGGLALCSANELSFNVLGFAAAIGANVSECLQNVFSKKLISGTSGSNKEEYKYSPAELQFYTSAASMLIQAPTLIYLIDFATFRRGFTEVYFWCCVLNGVFFHLQTISAYVLMDYISPVTHSVANTAKRALLIWLSVMLFGNAVTPLSGLGTVIVIAGVLLYNKAREVDALKPTSKNRVYNLQDAHDS